MSRILKFRVWDDQTKTMSCFDITETYGHIPNDLKHNIQQFTGHVDETGKEIYEGDIIESFGSVAEIVWSKTNSMFMSKVSENFYRFYNPECMKVIGNIFENPELVKSRD